MESSGQHVPSWISVTLHSGRKAWALDVHFAPPSQGTGWVLGHIWPKTWSYLKHAKFCSRPNCSYLVLGCCGTAPCYPGCMELMSRDSSCCTCWQSRHHSLGGLYLLAWRDWESRGHRRRRSMGGSLGTKSWLRSYENYFIILGNLLDIPYATVHETYVSLPFWSSQARRWCHTWRHFLSTVHRYIAARWRVGILLPKRYHLAKVSSLQRVAFD